MTEHEQGNSKSWTTVVLGLILIGGLLFFCLSYHIVGYPGGFTLIPKQHLTLAGTHVDLGEFIKEYNRADIYSRMSLGYLAGKLEQKGLLSRSSSPD